MSDVVLFLAFWPAVALGQRPYSAPLRSLLWLVALYQAATLFTVVNNPYTANVVEWFHAWFLTGGALVVGWALGRAGRGAVALTPAAWPASCVIAVSTVAQGVANLAAASSRSTRTSRSRCTRTSPACVLGFGALVAYVHPPWMRWPRLLALSDVRALCLGLLFTQSRQAIVGLAVALAVVVLRSDETRQALEALILGGVGAARFRHHAHP